jgi:hypothetical protein
MAQSKPGVAFAVTHSLEKAKQRYPWARAWVQVKGGIWCFEDEREARTYQPETFHELFVGHEPKR